MRRHATALSERLLIAPSSKKNAVTLTFRLPSRIFRLAVAATVLAVAACATSAHEVTQPRDPFAARFRTLHPSVVLITMRIPAEHPHHHGDQDDAYGTGLVVASGAWGTQILTDAHVVDGAHDLHALVGDADRAPARVIAKDEQDDLALLETPLTDRRIATLGTSRTIVPGDAVGVIGYPIPDAFEDEKLGTTASIYTGHVSSIRRDSFELDLSIIPGESGGPVFDAETGNVIGIAESRFDEEHEIGFATPIDVAKRFLRKHARR